MLPPEQTFNRVALQVLDSKVDDLLDLDDAALRKLLKPCDTSEVVQLFACQMFYWLCMAAFLSVVYSLCISASETMAGALSPMSWSLLKKQLTGRHAGYNGQALRLRP